MGLLRSPELQKHIVNIQKWALHSPEEVEPLFNYNSEIFVSNSIWEDIEPVKFFKNIFKEKGQIDFGLALLKSPMKDATTLIERQKAILFFKDKKIPILNSTKYDALEWFRNTTAMKKNYLYNLLFPSAWYMKWLYAHPDICTVYHLYHCYFAPLSNIAYPFTLLLTPLWFMKYKIKLDISISRYIQLIYNAMLLIKHTSKTSFDWYKFIVGVLVYSCLYVYATAQMVDLSMQLHLFRSALMDKVKQIISIQKHVKQLYKKYGKYEFWKPFEKDIDIADILLPIDNRSATIYKILSCERMKEQISKLCKVCVIHDTLITVSKLLQNKWCIPKYGDETFIGNMKNPSLTYAQTANPIRLHKHIIISGANAGGKTTYVKSLLWNILLGQSFGIVYGDYAQLKIYDGVLHHHRIKDITGEQSLFQAEMFKIKESLEIISSHDNVIYFMDEPMHSTNPIDGSIMLKALLRYFGNKENIRIILTSHFFTIQEMEKEMPLYFKNVCVKAKVTENTDIFFDFKIYKGGSVQTVGIELLEQEGFPQEIFNTAMEMKKDII